MSDDYIESTQQWLLSFLPDLINVKWEEPYTLIIGLIQSGKTEFTLGILLMYRLKYNLPCVFLLRPSIRDSVSITEKIIRFSEKHVNHMKSIGFSSDDCPTLEPVCIDQVHYRKGKLENYKKIVKIFKSSKTHSKIVIAINHPVQLRKLIAIIDKAANPKFVLAMDEADYLGYHQIKNKPYPLRELHIIIREKCTYAIGITATGLDILAGEKLLTNKNIVAIRPSSLTYHGWQTVERNCLALPVKYMRNIDFVDPNIKNYYYDMTKVEPFDKVLYNFSDENNHPIIVLHTATDLHKHHIDFFKFFESDEYLCKNWIYIREDGTGTYIYGDFCKEKDKLTIGGHTSKLKKKMDWTQIIKETKEKIIYKEKARHFYFPVSIDTPSVLQWFYDNGGVEKFKRIVIKTGDGGRCQSYVSTNGKWHLTHQYYIPPRILNVSDAEQNLRILHDRPDSIPLVFTSTPVALTAIQSGHLAQKELIDRLSKIDSEICVYDQLKTEKFSRAKFSIPEKSVQEQNELNAIFQITLFKKVPNPLELVYGEDGGDKIDNYVISIHGLILEKKEKKEKKAKEKKITTTKSTIDKIVKSLKSKKTSNISIFLSSLDSSSDKVYSRIELEYLLKNSKYEQPGAIFSSITSQSGWGPGIIFDEISHDQWKIKDDLKKAWYI